MYVYRYAKGLATCMQLTTYDCPQSNASALEKVEWVSVSCMADLAKMAKRLDRHGVSGAIICIGLPYCGTGRMYFCFYSHHVLLSH